MKKFNFLLTMLLGSALIFGTTSCSKDDDDQVNFAMGNQDFVTRASSSNMFEIAAGGLAIEQGTDLAVKAFGQHMVEDHSKAATEMKALADKKGWTISAEMLPEHRQKIEALQALSGSEFNRQFAAMMVTSHQQTIELFDQAAKNDGVPDSELRGFASGKLPTLRHHLEEAEQLRAEVND